MPAHAIEKIDTLFGEHTTTIAKDLKINFRRLLEDSTLSQEEAILTTIACAKTVDFRELLASARESAIAHGMSQEVIQEAEESAAIMGMLNVYYRFRHFIEHNDPSAKEEYGAAKLRMTSLGNPHMGKEKFEMLAFAVSAINGCEMCVSSHERALLHTGTVTRDKIHDLGRLAAVITGLKRLL